MKSAGKSHSAPRLVLLALVTLLGLAVVAAGSNAAASDPGHAVAAKKCKKHKRSARSAKKKKCKLHHIVLPAPAPLVRGTLSWTANVEVDLHAFDANGAHAGWDFNVGGPDGSLVNNIPSAHHNGDVGPGGPSESFTDDTFVVGGPANREFSYVACIYGASPSTQATFTGVARTGQSSSVPLTGAGSYSLTIPGGPPIPFNPC